MWETWVRALGWEDPLDEGMVTHSSVLAWRIPMDRGAWWATVHRVAKSQTQLKQLNMHTHKHMLFNLCLLLHFKKTSYKSLILEPLHVLCEREI